MKTFSEYISEKTPADDIGPNLPQYKSQMTFRQMEAEVRRVIEEAMTYLKSNPEEDRIEFTAFSVNIRVWRTKINTIEKYHLGRKSVWEKGYHETSVDDLVEYLVKHGY